jgi:hypothetical protein
MRTVQQKSRPASKSSPKHVRALRASGKSRYRQQRAKELHDQLGKLCDDYSRLGRGIGCDSLEYQRGIALMLVYFENSTDELRSKNGIMTPCAEHAGGPCAKHQKAVAA